MLKSCLEKPIYAALPRDKEREMKSRHLGLVMGFEEKHDLAALAAWVEGHAEIDQMLKLNAPIPALTGVASPRKKAVRIGVAMDEAFCFYYYDNLKELERCGAELVHFSPIRDELPDVDGLYLGGGYPELYAPALEKGSARRQIKEASEEGMPIYGECGGLMYLGEELVMETGRYKMAGGLPGSTIMTAKLVALGYARAEVVGYSPLAGLGRSILGHEFHYSRFECDRDSRFAYRMSRGRGICEGRDGLVEHSTLGAYLHAHFFSHSPEHFIDECQRYQRT